MYFDNERVFSDQYDLMKGSYLGPYYSNKEIITTNKKHKAVYEYIESFEELTKRVAKLISEGNVVGWFQGRSEYGPRALGNRSILADPRNKDMQKKLNLKINIEGLDHLHLQLLRKITANSLRGILLILIC